MSTLKYISDKYGLDWNLETKMPIQVNGLSRYDLPALFSELNFNIGAEVGVYRGEFSEKLCSANPKLKLFCVDSWEGGFASFYDEARTRLEPYNCKIIKKTSLMASADFRDGSLDFVHIDADHAFGSVVVDIGAWIGKIRSGGIICGHDFVSFKGGRAMCHVIEAVTGWTKAYDVSPWFILGSEDRDNPKNKIAYKSWLWIKN